MVAEGITKYALAKRLKMEQSTVERWFKKGAMPEIFVLIRISERMNKSLDYLLGREQIYYMNEEDNKRLGLLIFALARGDVSVLEDIYLLMVKILYAIGNIYFNQKADIEDVIQDSRYYNKILLINHT